MLDIREKDGVLLVRVRLQPGASSDSVAGEHGGALKLKVHAPPERGRANRAAAELLARSLGLKASSVSLVRGALSRDKLFALEGIGREKVLSLVPRVGPRR